MGAEWTSVVTMQGMGVVKAAPLNSAYFSFIMSTFLRVSESLAQDKWTLFCGANCYFSYHGLQQWFHEI